MDIKGAFGNICWPILIDNIKKSPCPNNLINRLMGFFQHRYVSLEEKGIKSQNKHSTSACKEAASARSYGY